jgi:hypothetical protein
MGKTDFERIWGALKIVASRVGSENSNRTVVSPGCDKPNLRRISMGKHLGDWFLITKMQTIINRYRIKLEMSRTLH